MSNPEGKRNKGASAVPVKRNRFTTRHLAALEFLTNIKMSKEQQIIEKGSALSRFNDNIYDEYGLSAQDDEDYEMKELLRKRMLLKQQSRDIDGDASADTTAVGRKLQGQSAPTMKVPLQFRYKLVQLTETSAVVRNWEDTLLYARGNRPSLQGTEQQRQATIR